MTWREWAPRPLVDHVLHFEAQICEACRDFSARLPDGSSVLDAGAGEGQYATYFASHRYTGADLAIGDANWDYSHLDVLANLETLPFRRSSFDAVLNIVTLEHVRHPQAVIEELARILRPGGLLLLVTPHEWEEHQQPHDFYRYTRYGLTHLLGNASLEIESLRPVGGYFRLLQRRLLNGVQFFPGPFKILAALAAAPPALLLPLLEGLDRERNFTLGHICVARKL